ncbi:DDE-type integrase/transposase/recombinase [Synechococcus sp. A15-44]|uniref:DDE-type integrase/transposase/recombinase n=1 Tax=Synechococcus sp. A15-44 TaxID=1050646 RepID=UPI001860FB47|nr:DDE-type integrase/transposase/recombinase [Synechococcus sp. A15-44]QNI64110.1 transposase [Synechococcus sp. A15-44]
MIHVDTKQLARFERIGHRITGDRRLGSSRGAGYEKAHVAIDDATRLADAEVLPDEKQATTVGFLLRAVAWFDTQGMTCKRVLSDNGSAFRSKPWREACIALSLTPKRTRPYTPRTNGKAERFIKTLLAEWAYSMPFQTSGGTEPVVAALSGDLERPQVPHGLGGPHSHSAARLVTGY